MDSAGRAMWNMLEYIKNNYRTHFSGITVNSVYNLSVRLADGRESIARKGNETAETINEQESGLDSSVSAAELLLTSKGMDFREYKRFIEYSIWINELCTFQ